MLAHLLSCAGQRLGYLPGRAACFTTLQFCGGGEGLKRRQCCCWLTSGGLPGTYPISTQFTHFPYVTAAFSAAALVVAPRVGGFACVLDSPKKPAVYSASPIPTGFYSQKLCGFIFPGAGTLGCVVWTGFGIICLQGVPLIFIHRT